MVTVGGLIPAVFLAGEYSMKALSTDKWTNPPLNVHIKQPQFGLLGGVANSLVAPKTKT